MIVLCIGNQETVTCVRKCNSNSFQVLRKLTNSVYNLIMFMMFIIDYTFEELLCTFCIMTYMGQILSALIVHNSS
jgi:hypothetical protein